MGYVAPATSISGGAPFTIIAWSLVCPQTEQTRDTWLTGEVEASGGPAPAFSGGSEEGGTPMVWNSANRDRPLTADHQAAKRHMMAYANAYDGSGPSYQADQDTAIMAINAALQTMVGN